MPVTQIDFPLDKLTRPQTEEEIQRKLAQERARLASMMGLDSGPVRHFKRPVGAALHRGRAQQGDHPLRRPDLEA